MEQEEAALVQSGLFGTRGHKERSSRAAFLGGAITEAVGKQAYRQRQWAWHAGLAHVRCSSASGKSAMGQVSRESAVSHVPRASQP
eukprot:1157941-Pelagomonas_calceolata.AAC.1